MKKKLSISIEEDVIKKLKEKQKKEKIPLSRIIEIIIRSFLNINPFKND